MCTRESLKLIKDLLSILPLEPYQIYNTHMKLIIKTKNRKCSSSVCYHDSAKSTNWVEYKPQLQTCKHWTINNIEGRHIIRVSVHKKVKLVQRNYADTFLNLENEKCICLFQIRCNPRSRSSSMTVSNSFTVKTTYLLRSSNCDVPSTIQNQNDAADEKFSQMPRAFLDGSVAHGQQLYIIKLYFV